jgi:hypothetical protein
MGLRGTLRPRSFLQSLLAFEQIENQAQHFRVLDGLLREGRTFAGGKFHSAFEPRIGAFPPLVVELVGPFEEHRGRL